MARDFVQTSEQYLSQIDAEIKQLQQLRQLVTEAIQGDAAVATSSPKAARKGMSAEGRRRVAEAQKARWAALKKAGGKAAKKTAKAAPSAE